MSGAFIMRIRAGYLEVLACTLTWGTIGSIVKDVDVPAPVIVFVRLVLGFAVVIGYMAVRGRLAQLRPGARPAILATAGIVLAVHWVMLFESFKRLEVASTILIVYLGPVLMAVAAPFVLRERLRAISVASLALAFGGIALIAVPDLGGIDRVGLVLALGSAVLFAVLMLVGKILSYHYEPAAIVVWQLGVAALVLTPALTQARVTDLRSNALMLVFLGVVHSGVLGIVFFHAMRALQAQQLGVMLYLEPASAVMYAWWLLGERPGLNTLAGGVLVVIAGIAIILSDRATATGAGARVLVEETG